MKTTTWIIVMVTTILSTAGCMYASGDADDSEGGLALDPNGIGGEPAGNNNSLYDEINDDMANADPFMQDFMNYVGNPPEDTEDTDLTGDTDSTMGGAVCQDLADCVCPMTSVDQQAACYDSIDLMSESDCTELYAQYSGLC